MSWAFRYADLPDGAPPRRRWRRAALVISGILMTVAAAPAAAQPEPVNGMRPADVRRDAIVGATVVTQPGVRLESATIVMRDGTVEAVGTDVDVPPAARVWPGEGLTVYAGLIEPSMLVDAGPLPAAPGRHWNDHVHPELAMMDQPPLDVAVSKQLRELGFTTAAVFPSKGIFRGSGTVVALADSDDHHRAYRTIGPLSLSLERVGSWTTPQTPGSLMGVIALVRQTLIDARWHQQCREIYARAPEGNEPPVPATALVALEDVIERRRSVLFDVDNEQTLIRAARIALEFDLNPIMLGGGREFARLDEIAALEIPIIVPLRYPEVPDTSTLHRSDAVSLREMIMWEQAPTNPRRLVERGVPVALTTHRLKKRAEFPKALRSAIRHGLTEDEALAAMTTTPARLLGLDQVLGTIEPGKIANLVVVEGNLFEKDSEIRDTWINGRRYEVNPAPHHPLEMEARLRTEDGREVHVDLDTIAPSATFRLAEDQRIKARKVVVLKDQISMVVDAAVLGERGYAQLSGVSADDKITGVALLPDGTRLPFIIEADDQVGAPHGKDAAVAGVSGTWTFDVNDADGGAPFSLTMELTVDTDGNVTGDGTVDTRPVDLAGGSYEAGSKRLELELRDPDGQALELAGTVEGPTFSGEGTREGAELEFTARRDENGEGSDGGFEMPPEELATPIGAFARSAPPDEQDVLIEGATIWTCGPDGILEDASMLVRGGRIVAVGRDLDVDFAGLLRIDGTGRHVTPGLMDCHSHTGISGGVNEFPQANTAEVRIGDVVNPDDINWYRQLAGGLTAANLLHGSANPIGGQNCVVKLKWGGAASEFPIADAIGGIKFALGENVKRRPGRYPDTRMGVETFIRDAFTAAREYRDEHARYEALSRAERRRTMPPRRDLELDTLVEILEGERIIHCHSYRQDEILMLIRVAEEFGFTIGTFQHVLEGYKVAEALAAHGAGASSFSDWWAYKVEVMDAIPHNGAIMHDVGVLVTFNSDSSELARRMNAEAAKAVRYGGVDPHEALGFVTINVARQLRVDHRTGSLEVGKDADFAIWNGSPLSTYTACEQTWIEGRRYFDLEEDLAQREEVARERYRLVQKLLAKEHGDPRGDGDVAAAAAHASGEFADLDEETIAWMEEQVRLGATRWTSGRATAGAEHCGRCVRRSTEMKRAQHTAGVAAGLLAMILVTASLGRGAAAQSRQVPAPRQQRTVVVHSGAVHPVAGAPIERGYVVFRDGVITDVGAGAPPRLRDAEQVDARGLHVYPGLIGSDTTLGLQETGAVPVTHDHTETGRLKPEVRAAVAINPDSDLIPVARANGILTAMVFPRGGLVSGRGAMIRLDGWTWEDLTIDSEAGLIVNWPRTEPVRAAWMKKSEAVQRKEIRERLDQIDQIFDDAVAYVKSRDHDATVRTDLRFEAMRPVITGQKPVFVRAASAGQIEAAVAWAVRRGYGLVVVGANQADRVIPLLVRHDVPVVVPGLHRMPSSRSSGYDEVFTLPARLHEAGVRFCISSGAGSAHERNLNHNAATAAAYGLPRDVALKAVTEYPAEIMGVGDRLGTLEQGKAATLIVTSGDPLEITTEVLVAFIDGRRIDLGNRHKAMDEKYREKYRQLGLVE